MLDNLRITEIAGNVVRAQVAGNRLERILAAPTTDSEGKEALRITLVLKPDAAKELTGAQAVDVLVGIQQSLWREGEQRFPIVEYATEQELREDEDIDRQSENEN